MHATRATAIGLGRVSFALAAAIEEANYEGVKSDSLNEHELSKFAIITAHYWMQSNVPLIETSHNAGYIVAGP